MLSAGAKSNVEAFSEFSSKGAQLLLIKNLCSKSLIMARINLLFLLSTVFAYGGYHVPEFLPAKQRNWLEKIVDNLQGKISRSLRN